MTQPDAVGAANVIRELMRRQGRTKSDLARSAKVSRSYVTQALSSEPQYNTVGSLNTMELFANAMGQTFQHEVTPLPVYQTPKQPSRHNEGKLIPRKKGGKK